MNESDVLDCIIIGGGPAGLIAGIYLKRFLRTAVLFDYGKPRAEWIDLCHNLIGYDKGISGTDLLQKLRKQTSDLELTIINEEAKIIGRDGTHFRIRAGSKDYVARKLLLASGFKDRQPPWENVIELRKHGLLRYCPVCDSYEHRDKVIAVYAGDRHAIDEALFLLPFVKSLTLLATPSLKIDQKFEADLKERKVEIVRNRVATVQAVRQAGDLCVRVVFEDSNYKIFDAIYIALGFSVPLNGLEYLGVMNQTETGLIKTNLHQETSIPGIYAAGDCVEGLAQITVASSQGAIAAVRIHNQLPSSI